MFRHASMKAVRIQTSTSVQLCSANSRRVKLFISPPDNSVALIQKDAEIPVVGGFFVGLPMAASGHWLILDRNVDGEACTSAWFGLATIQQLIMGVIEVFELHSP